MADEVKSDDVVDDGGLGDEVPGVTMDGLYGAMDAADATVPENETPFADLAVTDGNADGVEDEVPEDAKPTVPKVTEPTEEVKPEPDKEPKTETKESDEEKPPWDAERQRRDQERANLRKENEALKLRQAAMEREAAELKATMTYEKNVATTRPSDVVMAEIESIPDIDPLDDPEAYGQAQRKLFSLQKEHARALKLEADTTLLNLTAPQRDEKALDDILTTVCGTDNKMRNAVIRGLQKEWDEQGYGDGNFPTPREVFAIAKEQRAMYLLENGTKPAQPKPKVPVQPNGKGGTVPMSGANRLRPSGTMEDAKDDLRRLR